MIKKVSKICKYILVLIGVFFIVMAFDVFAIEGYTLWELVGGFLISCSPGIGLILLTVILWKHDWILGIIIIVLGTFFIFFFGLLEEFPERLLVFFVIVVPLYFSGIIFILKRLQTKA
jgi:hypothetical protein